MAVNIRRKASLPTIGIWSIMTYLRSQESEFLPKQLKTVSKSDKTLTSMLPPGAVGLITTGKQAEEILQNGRADLVFIGRQLLKDPFWPRAAAEDLKHSLEPPVQYTRYGSVWL